MKKMHFIDHLEELRWTLIKSIIAILIGACISYRYADLILYWLIMPTQELSVDFSIQVLKVTSMFTVKLIIAFFGGITLAFPMILYQSWSFISPAFDKKYDFAIIFTFLFSIMFFILGIFFAYFIIIPFSLFFFTSLISETVEIQYNFTLESYMTYILLIILGCGIMFQFPVLSTFLSWIGFLTTTFLIEYRKLAIVFFLIFSAFLTPPDPLSQIITCIPFVILYEISIVIAFLTNKKDVK